MKRLFQETQGHGKYAKCYKCRVLLMYLYSVLMTSAETLTFRPRITLANSVHGRSSTSRRWSKPRSPCTRIPGRGITLFLGNARSSTFLWTIKYRANPWTVRGRVYLSVIPPGPDFVLIIRVEHA